MIMTSFATHIHCEREESMYLKPTVSSNKTCSDESNSRSLQQSQRLWSHPTLQHCQRPRWKLGRFRRSFCSMISSKHRSLLGHPPAECHIRLLAVPDPTIRRLWRESRWQEVSIKNTQKGTDYFWRYVWSSCEPRTERRRTNNQEGGPLHSRPMSCVLWWMEFGWWCLSLYTTRLCTIDATKDKWLLSDFLR